MSLREKNSVRDGGLLNMLRKEVSNMPKKMMRNMDVAALASTTKRQAYAVSVTAARDIVSRGRNMLKIIKEI